MSPFPEPGTAEGQRWAAAGYPIDQATGQPQIPPAPAAEPASPFPAPGTPEGDRWAAAGHPVDPATHLPVIPPAVGNGELSPGDLVGYPCHDAYAVGGARNRVQAIVVIGTEDTGAGGVRVRGLAIGYADDAASFTADQLVPLA